MQRELFAKEHRRKQIIGYFYIDKKRVRRRLCGFEDAGLDEAGETIDKSVTAAKKRAAMLDALHREAERKLLEREAAKQAESQSIKSLFDEFITFNEGLKAPNTIYNYRSTRDSYLKAVGGDHPIAEGSGLARKFSLRRADRFITTLKGGSLSDHSINIRIQVLNAFQRWCFERDFLDALMPIKQLRTAKKLPKTLTHDELQDLFSRIQGLKESAPNRKHRAAYEIHERTLMMGLGTGMRLSEIVFLRWDQIDLKQATARVEMQTRFSVKEKREKILALPRFLVKYMKNLRAGNIGMQWYLDDGMGNLAVSAPDTISLAFRRHFKELGFDKRGIKPVHGLRAIFADELRKAGMDVWTIKETLGHSDIKVTQGYFSGTDENKRRAADSLESFGAKLTQKKSKSKETYAR